MSGFRTGFQSRLTVATIAFGFYAAAFNCQTMAAERTVPSPDLSGQWGRDMLFFEPPPSGPGPLINAVREAGGTVAVLDPCCAVATPGLAWWQSYQPDSKTRGGRSRQEVRRPGRRRQSVAGAAQFVLA